MKKPKNSGSSSSGLLTNESNSLTHSLSSLNHAPPPPSTAAQSSEREKSPDDGGGYDDDDVEERGDVAEKLSTRRKLAEGFFEVEAIRRKRICKGEPLYLIKWRGWPESANTWEPVEHLQTCPDVIEAYEERLLSGQKKNSSKRKRKFTQQKKSMQYPYGATKSKISSEKMSLSNEKQETTTLGNFKDAQSQPSMVEVLVKHDKAMKRCRSVKKVDRNGSRTVSPIVLSSEKDHSESVQLSDQNGSGRNSDVHLQQPVHAEGDGPANQISKSTCVESAQNNQRKGAQRRKSGSVRRFMQDITSFNVDCYGIPVPVNASTSEEGEHPRVGSSDVSRKKRSDSSRSTTITKIIKPISYSASVTNSVQDVTVTFVVMRSDGKEVMVDNKYLKATNPLLLINFYEQHLRYNPN
ncbi:hypothetical protein vseg_018870 [Gypsophila vaccaria]